MMSAKRTYYIELSPDGSISRSSRGAVDWLEDHRSNQLQEKVSELNGRDEARTQFRIDGAAIRIVQLRGENETRYLATIKKQVGPDSDVCNKLTDRQLEVAEYAASGATAKEIAATLDISPNTVKHHLKNIYDRLGIGSRVELADRLRGSS